MAKEKFVKTAVVFTGKDYLEDKKSYKKKDVSIKFFDFESVELNVYDKPDTSWTGTVIGKLDISWIGSFFIWENDGEYGTFWGWTIQKELLYFNIKKWLARRGEAPSYTITFRELDNGDTEKKESSEDEDLPF